MDDFTNSPPHASRPRTQIDDGTSLTAKGLGGGDNGGDERTIANSVSA